MFIVHAMSLTVGKNVSFPWFQFLIACFYCILHASDQQLEPGKAWVAPTIHADTGEETTLVNVGIMFVAADCIVLPPQG